MGSQGSLGWDTLGWDTLGGPMGPWDRWDLGTDGTWASRTPDTSSEDTSSELFIDTRPGPARPQAASYWASLVPAVGYQARCKKQQSHLIINNVPEFAIDTGGIVKTLITSRCWPYKNQNCEVTL